MTIKLIITKLIILQLPQQHPHFCLAQSQPPSQRCPRQHFLAAQRCRLGWRKPLLGRASSGSPPCFSLSAPGPSLPEIALWPPYLWSVGSINYWYNVKTHHSPRSSKQPYSVVPGCPVFLGQWRTGSSSCQTGFLSPPACSSLLPNLSSGPLVPLTRMRRLVAPSRFLRFVLFRNSSPALALSPLPLLKMTKRLKRLLLRLTSLTLKETLSHTHSSLDSKSSVHAFPGQTPAQ